MGEQGERGGAHQYFLTRFASAKGKNGSMAKYEVRSANVDVKTSRTFIIFRRPEHTDTFRRDFGMSNVEVRMRN